MYQRRRHLSQMHTTGQGKWQLFEKKNSEPVGEGEHCHPLKSATVITPFSKIDDVQWSCTGV